MIFGIGTDMIEVKRVKDRLAKTPGLTETLFTQNEIAYCNEKNKPEQHFAARFAAKEAFFKALGTGWRDGIKFNEIEIRNNHLGKPSLKLKGKALNAIKSLQIKSLHCTLSHLQEIASATVIIEI